MAVLPAAVTDCRRVDDGHHLADVFLQETIKERFVAILQSRQEHIALEVTLFSLVVFVGAGELLFDCGTVRWKQPQKPELSSLVLGKRTALVEQRIVQ